MYTLESLKEICSQCRRCGLSQTRNHVVFGEGSKNAKIMFIGEGPGEQEDLKGRPFVGRAGQLLDKTLMDIGLKREDFYIANIVKCRPPGNRIPTEDETRQCIEYLRWQVKLISPKILVLLGSTACKAILDKNFKITRQRGEVISLGKFTVLPTYHPAAILRDDKKQKDFFDDISKLKHL